MLAFQISMLIREVLLETRQYTRFCHVISTQGPSSNALRRGERVVAAVKTAAVKPSLPSFAAVEILIVSYQEPNRVLIEQFSFTSASI